MTCSHCAGVVTKAIRSIDANANVSVDYGTKIVTVETFAALAQISKVVDEADYPNPAV